MFARSFYQPIHPHTCSGLIVESITTHAPPRSSPSCGMYTNMGWLYSRSASTMYAPNLRISPYMSRTPPANPLKLANIMSGSSSLFISRILWAVLKAESGNQTYSTQFSAHITPISEEEEKRQDLCSFVCVCTCPACWMICCCESSNAGSGGKVFSTIRVSTATTPIGRPPRRARPVTTVRPQWARDSMKEPESKKFCTARAQAQAQAQVQTDKKSGRRICLVRLIDRFFLVGFSSNISTT